MAEQSKWATNVGGILGGILGENGAADEIAAIGTLGRNNGQTVAPVSTAGNVSTGGNSVLYIGLALAAVFLIFFLMKK